MQFRLSKRHRFEALLQEPREARAFRGFCFEGTLTVEAPVDPLSGMTVNLADIERWWDELLGIAKAKRFAHEEELLDFFAEGFAQRCSERVVDCAFALGHGAFEATRSRRFGRELRHRSRCFVNQGGIPREREREVRLRYPAGELVIARSLCEAQTQAWGTDQESPILPGPEYAWLETAEIDPVTGERFGFTSEISG